MASKRYITRETVLQTLFEDEFHNKTLIFENLIKIFNRINEEMKDLSADKLYGQILLKGIVAKKEEIDKIIESVATNWPIDRMLAVDRNILRIGLFEMLFGVEFDTPPKVAINEAIELAKVYGGNQSYKFINGVLGKIYTETLKDDKDNIPSKKNIYAVGGLVYTKKDNIFYFAFVKDVSNKWTLPKKTIKKTDDEVSSVVNGIKDELGLLNPTIVTEIENVSFISHPPEGPVRKEVKYFLMHSDFHDLTLHKTEGLIEAKWIAFDDIDQIKKYKDLNSIIKKGMEVINKNKINN